MSLVFSAVTSWRDPRAMGGKHRALNSVQHGKNGVCVLVGATPFRVGGWL